MTFNFTKTQELAGAVFNTAVILDDYCKENAQEELIERIVPVLKHLRHDADRLYSQFFNPDD